MDSMTNTCPASPASSPMTDKTTSTLNCLHIRLFHQKRSPHGLAARSATIDEELAPRTHSPFTRTRTSVPDGSRCHSSASTSSESGEGFWWCEDEVCGFRIPIAAPFFPIACCDSSIPKCCCENVIAKPLRKPLNFTTESYFEHL